MPVINADFVMCLPHVMPRSILKNVDQAAPAHQSLLRDQQKLGENQDMNLREQLRSRRHRLQTARLGGQPPPNPTNSQPDSVREDAHFTGTSTHRTAITA